LADDPVDQRWQQHMSQFVESFAQNPEGLAGQSLRHVWTMTEQAASEQAGSEQADSEQADSQQ
jgi:hypothetical protein